MDYIAGSFYDGFVLYAMALEETMAEGGAQNDGISITLKMQNRHMWGEQIGEMCLKWCAFNDVTFNTPHNTVNMIAQLENPYRITLHITLP